MIWNKPATKDVVIAEALTLTESDRIDIIERLSESLGEVSETEAGVAWESEVDRRLDSIAAGQATFISGEEARRRIVGKTDVSHP